MSQQDKKKNFFWRIHSDFFHKPEIDDMEAEPYGKDLVLIYLKLLCEASLHGGWLVLDNGVPCTKQKLKRRTGGYRNFDKAWDYLVENKYIEAFEDGTLYMPYAAKQSGKETGQTLRNRENGVENFNQDKQEIQPDLNNSSTITTTTTKDRDISINKTIDKTTTTTIYNVSGGSYTGIRDSLTTEDVLRLSQSYGMVDELISRVDDEVRRKRTIVDRPLEYVMGYAENKNWYKRELL